VPTSTTAVWNAAQANAKAKAEPRNDTDAENRIDDVNGDDISTDTGPTVGDSPTTKPEETSQPSVSPDNRLELSR